MLEQIRRNCLMGELMVMNNRNQLQKISAHQRNHCIKCTALQQWTIKQGKQHGNQQAGIKKQGYSWLMIALMILLFHSMIKAKVAANELDQIVAVVNNDIVMMSEVKKRVALLRQTNPKARGLSPRALEKEAIDDLILERLQVQQAKERGIEVDDLTLNRTVERIAKKNRLNLPQFRQALAREGIDYNDYREQIRNKMVTESLRKRQVDKRIRVSDQEIEDLIISQSAKLNQGMQYRLQHILVSAPNGTAVAVVNAARQKAEKLRKRVLTGEDFVTVARSHSDGQAAQNGGDLGWQSAEKLPASFNRVLSLLPIGAVSTVVRDPKGFHILKLLEKQGGKQTLVDAARIKHILVKVNNGAEQAAAQQKIQQIYQQLQAGANFAALAKQYSDDTGSAAKGGDLGWVSLKQLVPQFAKVAKQQPLNTLSRPFRSQYGWHVLSVLERKQEDRSGDKLKLQAEEFLGNRKLEEEYQVWLQRLRDEAYIEYRPPFGQGLQLR